MVPACAGLRKGAIQAAMQAMQAAMQAMQAAMQAMQAVMQAMQAMQAHALRPRLMAPAGAMQAMQPGLCLHIAACIKNHEEMRCVTA